MLENEARRQESLNCGFRGEMSYMQRDEMERGRTSERVPGTIRVISPRLYTYPLRLSPGKNP